ncbi:mCG64214 [Mus musculus]|nr:mCG64214 [Mus musculus]
MCVRYWIKLSMLSQAWGLLTGSLKPPPPLCLEAAC